MLNFLKRIIFIGLSSNINEFSSIRRRIGHGFMDHRYI